MKLSDYLHAFCELGADESITETECWEHAKLVAADREKAEAAAHPAEQGD